MAQGDGPAVPLRTVVGDRPTIVAFWASYCVACQAEVPALNRAVDRWSARGLRVVGVSLESNAERVNAAETAWGMRYDVFRLASENDDLIGLSAANLAAGRCQWNRPDWRRDGRCRNAR